jgi:hypothetical protein
MGIFANEAAGLSYINPVEENSRFADLVPEEERGFIGNIAESMRRGKEQILSDVAVYEAMQSGENIEDALRARNKFLQREVVDPVEGNFLSNLVYKTAKVLPGWFESGKEAIDETILGAASGAGMAALWGQFGPQAATPEEVITVPAAAIKGAKVGYTMGSAQFWYKQGAGAMFADMLDKGYDPEKSKSIAKIAAVPYALLEFLQIKTAASPAFREGVSALSGNIVKKFAKNFGESYLKTLGKEVSEEVAQEIVQVAAEDIAGYASGQGVDLNKDYFMERAKRLGDVAWESTQAFSLLPIPRAAIEATSLTAKQQAQAEIEKDNKESKDAKKIEGYPTPTEVTTPTETQSVEFTDTKQGTVPLPTDPLGKLQMTLLTAADKYEEMKELHTKELGSKIGSAEERYYKATTAEKGLKGILANMKGKLSELKIKPTDIKLTGDDYESLLNEIRTTDKLEFMEKFRLSYSLDKLVKTGRLLRPSEMRLLGKQFGPQTEQAMANLVFQIKKNKGIKTMTEEELIQDLLGIPKALSATADISRTLRQNILLIGNPKAWYKGLKDEWKLFLGNEKSARASELAAMTGPYSHLWRRTNLRINEWGEKGTYKTRSEKFPSQRLSKLPLLARSERAYTAGGNLLRVFVFEQIAEEWENKEGFKASDKDYKDLAHIINLLTGEGDASAFGNYAAYLNATFFAPRLLAARFQAMFEVFNKERSWAARKVLAQHLVKFVAINSMILTLASFLPGVSVEKDPRSTDFGKIKFGNTRIDFWGGYQPIARLIVELISGQHKTQVGEIIPRERRDALMTFLQAKLAPVPSAALDFVRGETFYGQEVTRDSEGLTKELYKRLTPFIVQDIIDAARYNGISAVAITAPLVFHGVGVTSYDMTPGSKLTITKNRISNSVFGKKWDEIGGEAQKVLRETFPEIEKGEIALKYDYTSPKYLKKVIEDEYKSEKRILSKLSKSIQMELVDTKIKIGGLGRRIGADWYLNDQRFSVYENTFTLALNKILPVLFKSDVWEKLDMSEKQLVTAEFIAELKKEIRNQIIEDANYKDMEYLLERTT